MRPTVWDSLAVELRKGETCALLVVTESIGSSPGRTGFTMTVSSSGSMHGTIGGGSMEHKLVDLARSLLDQPSAFPFRKRQVHRDGEARDRSGMICSGEQTVAFYHFTRTDLHWVERVAREESRGASLVFTNSGIDLSSAPASSTGDLWFAAPLHTQPRIAIIGGGHVGVALSRIMHQLGFRVLQFDHRDELNTMRTNEWAHEKQVVDFARIEEFITDNPALFIALVSHGYRTDEIALRRLIRLQWKYLGMLGSKAKVETMWTRLKADGFTEEELARVHAPIGLAINSRTAEEIAVSIAAEVIAVRNATE